MCFSRRPLIQLYQLETLEVRNLQSRAWDWFWHRKRQQVVRFSSSFLCLLIEPEDGEEKDGPLYLSISSLNVLALEPLNFHNNNKLEPSG